MKTSTIFFLLIVLTFSSLWAKMFRVAQIPFGYVSGCANCHVAPKGGGVRNVFGAQVQANYLDGSGNVLWGSGLAQLDADNDLFTNGTELQDPTGQWILGQPLTGDKNLVSNPGDAGSVPPGTSISGKDGTNRPVLFDLEQNFPNPFNGATAIQFELLKTTTLSLDIYSVKGDLISRLVDQPLEPGQYQYIWDARDSQGQDVPSGIYIYCLQAGDGRMIKSMLYLK